MLTRNLQSFCSTLCTFFPECALCFWNLTHGHSYELFKLQIDLDNRCHLQNLESTFTWTLQLEPFSWYSMCGPWISGMSITWETVRIAVSQTPLQTYWNRRISILTRSLGWSVWLRHRDHTPMNPVVWILGQSLSSPPSLSWAPRIPFGQNHAICVHSFDLLISVKAKKFHLSSHINLPLN